MSESNKVDALSFKKYPKIGDNLHGGLLNYVNNHTPAGNFLTAVLENDLFNAISYADQWSLEALDQIVHWLYWETPEMCWGSKEKVKKWLEDDDSNK